METEPAKARHELVIDGMRTGQTLAAVVRAQLENLPWNQARELCRRGKVHINDEAETDGSRRVVKGDRVRIEPRSERLRPHVLDAAAVVYVDRQVVVVNKESGLLTLPFHAHDKNTLADRLRFWLRREHGAQGAELGVVQRLDKETSGLLVFARTLTAKRGLEQQLRVHSIERRYLALVHGELKAPFSVESKLVRDRGDGLRGSWGTLRNGRTIPRDAQRALTHVRPLERFAGATLCECQLETGRQHQIRIHLTERGHPLIGEQVYIREYRGTRIAAPRVMLHASVLGFLHPSTKRTLRFEQAPPEDFVHALARLREGATHA
jgi:23S rRNA pseudouridine1911/1915/1917 synthase